MKNTGRSDIEAAQHQPRLTWRRPAGADDTVLILRFKVYPGATGCVMFREDKAVAQLRRELGNYVDQNKVARLEQSMALTSRTSTRRR